jgi:hypothetical protein
VSGVLAADQPSWLSACTVNVGGPVAFVSTMTEVR